MTKLAATHVLVLAKQPVAGRAKTRLCPPCTPNEAAAIAEAALADTLEAVAHANVDRRVIALDGEPGPWLPAGFEIIEQTGGSLGDRLATAWAQVGGPGLQIGMDTPQISGSALDSALARLVDGSLDAVLGPAEDGGWWSIGFTSPCAGAFAGVPMSAADTGSRQLARLHQLGRRVGVLPAQRDLDTFADALAIADLAPSTRTAETVRRVALTVDA